MNQLKLNKTSYTYLQSIIHILPIQKMIRQIKIHEYFYTQIIIIDIISIGKYNVYNIVFLKKPIMYMYNIRNSKLNITIMIIINL